MKQRVLSAALAICLCISSPLAAYAAQEDPLHQGNVLSEKTQEETVPNVDEPNAPAETEPGQEDVPEEEIPGEEIPEETVPGVNEPNTPEETEPGQDDVPEEEIPGQTNPGADEPTTPVEAVPEQENILPEEIPVEAVSLVYPSTLMTTRDSSFPTPTEIYESMIALKDQDQYKEGTVWTNDEPYSDSKGYYHWNGGLLNGKKISAVGCVAFAFTLSDAAFGSWPARIYAAGEFLFEDIKAGDILQVNNDVHTVIVLNVSDVGVVVAEGNMSTGDHVGKVHWGRTISKEEVLRNTSHYITRYPEGYISPDDPEADTSIASGTLAGGLAWNLTKAGILTISGKGAMPDFSSVEEQPWSDNNSQIQKIVIGDGVTNIGSGAFWNCGALSVEIASSVTVIGNSAFRDSKIISATIPSGVKTIGDDAFRGCKNLSSVTIGEGVETIGQNVFRACTSLASITLPASIGEIGSATFMECTEMKSVKFTQGSKQVKLGDNMFTECWNLMSVTLPLNIDRIGEGMFQNCKMLAGVEIPQGAESIGMHAFASCSAFTTVIIPDSVTTIGMAAFADCPLKDIYFTGTETQWNSIGKLGDTASKVSESTIHYNYIPAPAPDPDDDNNNPGGGDDNNPGDNPNPGDDNNDNPGGDSDNNPGGNPDGDNDNNPGGNPGGDNGSNNAGSNNDKTGSTPGTSSMINVGIKAIVDTWKPTTPDEIKRYACVGKEAVQYTPSKDNAYKIEINNAIQGPMCFKSFEAVLGDYTIGRTYNIYPPSGTTYSMDKEVEFTIKIPSAIYKENREYKMICVTEDGQPTVYNDSDSDPETITIKTDKFYAYALIYK
ncbi:hypothetical protein C807_01145 [Lachnospiraceae bacterium 28-4]|nr:hypothetical protein C807_01145 [Lachnospiraceae bacterium 28-4]